MATATVYRCIPRELQSLHEQLGPFEGLLLSKETIINIKTIIKKWEQERLPDPDTCARIATNLISQLTFFQDCKELNTFFFPSALLATSIVLSTLQKDVTNDFEIHPNCRVIGDGKFLKKLGDTQKLTYEASILLSLPPHPNILNLLAVEAKRGLFGLIFSYHPLGDLFDAAIKNPEDVRKAAAPLAHGIAQGLAFLHAQRIIHSDLKPDNIVLTSPTSAIIIDFEHARRYSAGNLSKASLNTTALYLPPEYFPASRDLNHLRIEPSRDIWAVGFVFMWMINKEFFFQHFPMQTQVTSFSMRSFFLINPQKPIEEGLHQGVKNLKEILPADQHLNADTIQQAAMAALKISPQERITADNLCQLFTQLKI